jgi:hypothetical protein
MDCFDGIYTIAAGAISAEFRPDIVMVVIAGKRDIPDAI